MNTAFSRLRPLRFFMLLAVLTMILGCPSAKKEMKKERQIPEAEAQAQKEKEILELFKEKDADELPAIFLEKGMQTKDDPEGRFVLLRMARDYSADAFDRERAYQAVDELAKSFDEIDALEMKKDVMAKLVKAAKNAVDNYLVTDYALKLIHQCVEADKYEAANALLEMAESTRKKVSAADDLKDLDLRDQESKVAALKDLESSVAAAKKKVQEIQKEFEGVKAARDTLDTKADDKEANLTWGKFLCMIKGNWDKGLPLLEKSGDQDLAPLVKMEQEKPTNGDAQVKLGDKWWDMAEAEKGIARQQLKARAVFWYKKAASSISGLTLTRIQKRINEVSKKD